eukprot:2009882-Amphidinium_carterae.1
MGAVPAEQLECRRFAEKMACFTRRKPSTDFEMDFMCSQTPFFVVFLDLKNPPRLTCFQQVMKDKEMWIRGLL